MLHATQGGISHEKNVSLSNVSTVIKRKKFCPHFIPYERSFILAVRQEEWLVGDDPLYLKFWAKLAPFPRKRRFSIAPSTSAITPSKNFN